MNDKVIEVREVWKIFGDRAAEALAAIRRDGLDKAEVLERFEAVVGVRNVSFDVHAGRSSASWASPARASRPSSATSTG